ncbi:MAG TPA: helix-turn-helix transcriptional regulator [Ktedonobacteraceae bacterium]|nr:helix-turn-helix transcriptional regulator [Ktedonobacteraceae bacterium]
MMNNEELQQLKMAWLAAEEAGDKERQFALLRDHADVQEPLIDFIAAYRITESGVENAQQVEILPLTQRAIATTLDRVFNPSMAGGLRQLREQKGLSLVETARGLRLGIDVWKKFEDGVIELVSLSERQLERLANFFQVGVEQFGNMLNNSQPIPTLDRRQTAQAARNTLHMQKKQSFAEAVKKSTMSKEEKKEWLV